jgi:uncharacterized protein YdeI (YjbR/CyaY-like superfamily)
VAAVHANLSPQSAVETLTFASATAWEAWLAEHHTLTDGIWL